LSDLSVRYIELDNKYISNKTNCTVVGIPVYPIEMKRIPKYLNKIMSKALWPVLGKKKNTVYYLKSGSISNISDLSDKDKVKILYYAINSLSYLYNTIHKQIPHSSLIPTSNGLVDLPLLDIEKTNFVHDYSKAIIPLTHKLFDQTKTIHTPGISNLLEKLQKNYQFLIPSPASFLSDINDILGNSSKDIEINVEIDFNY